MSLCLLSLRFTYWKFNRKLSLYKQKISQYISKSPRKHIFVKYLSIILNQLVLFAIFVWFYTISCVILGLFYVVFVRCFIPFLFDFVCHNTKQFNPTQNVTKYPTKHDTNMQQNILHASNKTSYKNLKKIVFFKL